MFRYIISLPLLAAAVLAQGPNSFNVPVGGYSLTAGKTTTLEWTPTTGGTVTLVLRSGNAANLNQGTLIVANTQNNGKYSWSVPADITKGSDYTVEIIADGSPTVTNYTPQFPIDSTNTTPSSTAIVSISGMSSATASARSSSASASSASASSASASSASVTSSASSASASSASVTVSGTRTSNSGVVRTSTEMSTSTGAAATHAAGAVGAIAVIGGAAAFLL